MDSVPALEESTRIGMYFVIRSHPGAILDGSDAVQSLVKDLMSSLRLGGEKLVYLFELLDSLFLESIYLSA